MISGMCGARTTTCILLGAGANAEAFCMTAMALGTDSSAAVVDDTAPTSSANACTASTPRDAEVRRPSSGSNEIRKSVELKGHPCVTPEAMHTVGADSGALTTLAELARQVALAKTRTSLGSDVARTDSEMYGRAQDGKAALMSSSRAMAAWQGSSAQTLRASLSLSHVCNVVNRGAALQKSSLSAKNRRLQAFIDLPRHRRRHEFGVGVLEAKGPRLRRRSRHDASLRGEHRFRDAYEEHFIESRCRATTCQEHVHQSSQDVRSEAPGGLPCCVRNPIRSWC